MRKAQKTVFIGRPPHYVWDYLIDFSHDPQWVSDLAMVRIDTLPVELGTRVTEVRKFGKQTIDGIVEVVEWEPGRRLRKTTPPGAMVQGDGIFTLEPSQHGTQLTISYGIVGHGLGKLLEWFFIGPSLRENIEHDSNRLKMLLEQ